MDYSPWQQKVESILAEHEEADLYTKDLRFFHVDTLLKYAGHCERFSPQCPTCKEYMKIIETTAIELDQLLGGAAKGRIEYEKRFFQIEKHLKTDHKMVTARYHHSLFSLVGMLIGMLFGVMISQTINPNSLDIFLLGGWLIGLITGRILGSRKEKQLKAQGRYL